MIVVIIFPDMIPAWYVSQTKLANLAAFWPARACSTAGLLEATSRTLDGLGLA
jgi:hypothetical protein